MKLAALSAVPAVLVAVACLAAFGWYRRQQDPIELGKALNQRAWESSFATMLQNPDGRTKPDPGLDQR